MTPAEEARNKTLYGGLNPDSWFVETEKGLKFNPHKCAEDYLRVHPHVITEYVSGQGTPSQFVGDHWLKDAEGIIKTTLEKTGRITPGQIRGAVESICNLTRMVDTRKINLPLDQVMPLPIHTIPIDEGLFNLLEKTVAKHSPDYFYTECLPRRYISGAMPDGFIEFLDAIFQGDPDAELKKVQIFEIIAWTLMKNYDIQGAVILYGQGGEGKSIIHLIIALILVWTSSITLDELENDKFKRAELYGSWANLISESTTEIITSEWFKRLTDGTQITVDRKNGHPFRMSSHAKMIIDTNELPTKENELRAFYRRVIAIIDFPNMLEDILTPEQIRDTVEKLKSPDELDKIFSYVVDNSYAPLVQRMKFTGHLNINQAEKAWEERSNPAAAYIKLKDAAGQIMTDVEDARVTLMQPGADEKRMQRCITREPNGLEEYLTTIKQDVITEAVKWATDSGFPAKNIHAGTLGKALTACGYPNLTANKKIGKGSPVKAWRDVLVMTGSGFEVKKQDEPLPKKVGSRISQLKSGSGSTPVHEGQEAEVAGSGSSFPQKFLNFDQKIEGNRENATHVNEGSSATEPNFSLGNSEKKQVAGDLKKTATKPLPEKQEMNGDPSKSQSGDTKQEGALKEEVEGITAELLQHGYHVAPNHSPSMDGKAYHIRVLKAGIEGRLEDLKSRMAAHGFEFVNFQERYGYLFARELKGGSQ